MLKRFLFLLSLILVTPVWAGEYEDANRFDAHVFLYLQTPECGYCRQFDPIYAKLEKKYHNECKFVKIDANTDYGYSVMQKIGAHYVPYVLLINNQRQTIQRVLPQCLLNNACIKDAVEKFVK